MSNTCITPCILLFAAAVLQAQDARQIMETVQRQSRAESQRYSGALQVFDARGKISGKSWQYERLGSAGDSKVILRFTAPAEVKGVALLIVNHADRASDQWMWTPAVGRERRIAFQDRSTRFFGTDFSFEDLEERDTNQFDYRLQGAERCGPSACWKIEGRPREKKASQYSHSLLWIQQDNFVIARTESYRDSTLVRRITYGDLERAAGIWTPKRIEVEDIKRQSRTLLRLEKLEYNVKLDSDRFTLQALRRE
jgi:hypothetical protein